MADATSELSILIDIRAKLDELQRGQGAMRDLAADTKQAGEEANKLSGAFKTGLGIDVARRGIELLTGSLRDAIGFSARLSDEVERAGVRAGLSAESYQALGFHLRQAGGSADELVGSLEFLRRTLGDADDPKNGPGKALAEIGLSAKQLAGLPIEQALERIARGLSRISDENRRAALTASLLGRGSASLNDLLGQLATRGLGDLTREAQRATGVMNSEMAKAIDEAGDRAEAAREKFEKMLAPFTLGAKERSAALNQLKADLAEALVQNPGTSALAVAGTAGLAAAGGVALAGGLGSPQAWGLVAGVALARASALAVPVWTGIGALIAAGVLAAVVQSKLFEAAQNRRDSVKDTEDFQDQQRRALAASLNGARDPGAVARVQAEAARRARSFSGRAGEATDESEAARLSGISRAYSVIAAQAREQGVQIVANNRRLDEQAAAVKAAADAQALLVERAKVGGELEQDVAKFVKEKLPLQMAITRAAGEQARHVQAIRDAEAAALVKAEREAQLIRANAAVEALQEESSRLAGRADVDGITKQAKLAELYEKIRTALAAVVKLKEAEAKLETDPAKLAALQAEIDVAKFRAATIGSGEPARGLAGYRERANNARNSPDALTAGEGVEAGMLSWVTPLGSQGEQVARSLESSIGSVVHGISQGIYGWVTGTQTFGDALRGIGSSLLQTLLDTLVQMGAQWVINAALAKGSMVSTFLIGVGLRKAEAADTIATETAKTPSLAANAALASAGSFGLSAVIGIALLAALVGAFAAGGFANGGYTGDGGKYEYAGPAHRGEVVFSQADVARFGGPASLEDLRVGGPARARALSAPSVSVSSALASANASAPAKRERLIAIVPDMNSARALQRDPDFESVIVDVMQRRRGEILG